MTSALLNNRYLIIRALGTGGFGETFLAEDTHMPSGRCCAIKQLKPINNNPQVYQLVQERFAREAAILEQLGEGSEQIPQLYAYFAYEGEFYLVQEWIEGVTLNTCLQREGILNESFVKNLLVSLLPVLAYIHNKGIIHRDIKPSNIILRERDGKPVLIDFGIAKEMMKAAVGAQDDNTSTIAVGTRGYMPPEQAVGKPLFTSDIYSLGLTAICLLTGKHPQYLDADPETGEINWQKYAASISPSFAAVLDKAIQPYACDRYPSAIDMLLALEPQDRASPHLDEPIAEPPTLPPFYEETTKPRDPEATPVPVLREKILDPISPSDRQEYRNRQILLNKVKNYWIKGVLETSLHGKALIELGLEKRLDAIDRPWGIVWEGSDQARQTLPSNTKIIDLFDQMGAGRTLLILGDPGAGKTTTLLELARDLITRAEQDINQPIPVVFNLSAWTSDKIAVSDCLVRELNTKYQVSPEIGRTWVENQQLLLMLDGLDEVSLDRREYCIEAINKFSQAYGQSEIVITSRIKDYEALSHRLWFQGAIFIQPLTLAQIHRYLVSAGSELVALKTALQADTTLQELAKSPLMLSIMTLAYQGLSLTDLPGMNLEERRNHLFDKYIQRMFERRVANRAYSKEQSMQWLIWLAQKLCQKSQSVFLIERMQPSWLQTKVQKRIYSLSVILSFLILGTLIGNLLLSIGQVSVLLIPIGIIFWLIFGIEQIKPVESLKWSWKSATNNLMRGVIFGAALGLIIKIFYNAIFSKSHWMIFAPNVIHLQLSSLLRGVVFGLSIGLIIGLIRGLTSPCIETITVPNQGIWQSAKNAVVFGLIGFLGLGLAAAILHWRILFWGIFGLSFGLASGGGEACIKHFILRVILYINGYIPWNYARFLDYATERIFLQKVGGGYIFVHRLLLEHFAQQNTSRNR